LSITVESHTTEELTSTKLTTQSYLSEGGRMYICNHTSSGTNSRIAQLVDY